MPVRAQVAPGPLSRAHQQLNGITKCGSCHEFSAGAGGFKCLECHAEIRSRVDAKSGFHGRNFKKSADETDCRRCHKEHKGQAAPLIQLDRQKFDHQAQTGFVLAGKHRQQKCESCHTANRMSPEVRAGIKVKDPNHSFLGLRRECTACHKDQHQGQLGADCLRCHNPDAFKPATGFQHASTQFPLTGQHQSQPCQKCHGPKPGQPAAQYKGLAHSTCQNCHNDPHHGAFQEVKFRGACETCHNTNGWKSNQPGTNFDHSIAKFQLAGKHTTLACVKCHKGTDFHRPIPHEMCRDCHEDRHKGQFAGRAAGLDCSSCHDVTGFKPTRFDREMHRLSAFPLEGRHASLRCAQCHQPEGPDAVYRSGKLTCPACHTDRHGGEFAAAPHANNCADCHTVAGFAPTTFTLERHAKTRFPLTGKHTSVACEKCHKLLDAVNASVASVENATAPHQPRQYHFASRTCDTCHGNPHHTKVACADCHTTAQWKEIRPFDHSTTGFKIEGAHLKAKCAECHKPAEGTTGTAAAAPQFFQTPMQCMGCHRARDAHGGQFLGGDRVEDCAQCHVMTRWSGDDFDHDRTQFALNRVHRAVECAKCHKERRESAGKMVRVYRGTPASCLKCH